MKLLFCGNAFLAFFTWLIISAIQKRTFECLEITAYCKIRTHRIVKKQVPRTGTVFGIFSLLNRAGCLSYVKVRNRNSSENVFF